jgi:ubiquitin-protein ligase
MVDPRVRRVRLAKDFEKLQRIRCAAIEFDSFTPPAPERYEFRFRLRSLAGAQGDTPIYTAENHVHCVEIRLSPAYPERLVNDDVRFLSAPVFHPNVFTDGRVCIRAFSPSESLTQFVLRLARYIQCDPGFTGLDSPANYTAKDFFEAHPELFPTDHTVLPTGEKKFTFGSASLVPSGPQPRKRFVVGGGASRVETVKRRFVVSAPSGGTVGGGAE